MADPLGLIGSVGGAGMQPVAPPRVSGPGQTGEVPSFKDVLMQNLEEVNRLQAEAQTAMEDVSAGRRDDLAGVMMAKAKADTAFQMLLQVRNKLMDAYEEIKQMRV